MDSKATDNNDGNLFGMMMIQQKVKQDYLKRVLENETQRELTGKVKINSFLSRQKTTVCQTKLAVTDFKRKFFDFLD